VITCFITPICILFSFPNFYSVDWSWQNHWITLEVFINWTTLSHYYIKIRTTRTSAVFKKIVESLFRGWRLKACGSVQKLGRVPQNMFGCPIALHPSQKACIKSEDRFLIQSWTSTVDSERHKQHLGSKPESNYEDALVHFFQSGNFSWCELTSLCATGIIPKMSVQKINPPYILNLRTARLS